MLVLSVIGLVPVSLFSSQIAKACGVPEHFLRASAWSISILALFYALSNAGGAYEAIILGAHRVDICRKLATVTCVLEAVGIISALRLGYGLVAMACVIAMSEVVWVGYCYFASRRVLPQVRISARDVSKSVARELLRFVGSYQLLSVLQVTYGAVVPIAVLRTFGANSTGVLAIATRLISPVSMCQYAFLVPILSASAMVYASGSVERMRTLLAKSFKATLIMSLVPLTLISVFGTYIVKAWIGQVDPHLGKTLWLVSLAAIFQSFSLLAMVLYRTSGRALMDNVRELVRIGILIPVAIFAHLLGFYGVLIGMGRRGASRNALYAVCPNQSISRLRS